MQVDPGLQSRVNNALIQLTQNHSIYGQVEHAFTITPGFYVLKIRVFNGMHLIHALCWDQQYECRLFLDAQAFKLLILDPMTADVKAAINDYHSIGHGLPKGE
jgi:hypothetical protein